MAFTGGYRLGQTIVTGIFGSCKSARMMYSHILPQNTPAKHVLTMAGPIKAADLPSRVIQRSPSREEMEAEIVDPFAMGYDAAADLDDPPPCPFRDGIKAKLWRKGFSARVQEYIGRRMSTGGLKADLTS